MLYFKLDSGEIISSKDVVRTAEIAYGYNIDCTDDADVREIAERMVGIDHEVVEDIFTLVEQFIKEGRIFKATQVYHENADCTLAEAHLYVESVAYRLNHKDDSSSKAEVMPDVSDVHECDVKQEESAMGSKREWKDSMEDLAGKHVFSGIETGVTARDSFGGVQDSGYVKFTLDGINYVCYEDPDDGWRSYMGELSVSDVPCKYKIPDTECVCNIISDRFRLVVEFVDLKNDKVFLRIGTEDWDDWYPYCVMEYTPENLHWNDLEV